jgi:hypothetical protein
MMGMLVPKTCWGNKTTYFVTSGWFFTFHYVCACLLFLLFKVKAWIFPGRQVVNTHSCLHAHTSIPTPRNVAIPTSVTFFSNRYQYCKALLSKIQKECYVQVSLTSTT